LHQKNFCCKKDWYNIVN